MKKFAGQSSKRRNLWRRFQQSRSISLFSVGNRKRNIIKSLEQKSRGEMLLKEVQQCANKALCSRSVDFEDGRDKKEDRVTVKRMKRSKVKGEHSYSVVMVARCWV